MTLGSLFDGSGGFPLAARMCGIETFWASEIENYLIQVTKKNFPNMTHLGDITKINGAEIEPVDIITFGSPCQDLSIAGKRAGLEGERSNLFLHAIRIIKEMREKTNGKYPRFALWENVKGAFSSNNGEDFRTVLQEFCQIANEQLHVPQPKKWERAGCIVGNLAGGGATFRLPGGCLTRNIGAYPKDVKESSLSRILQRNVPPKYYLSVRACEGILRRAEKRGKKIPPVLERALRYRVAFSQ